MARSPSSTSSSETFAFARDLVVVLLVLLFVEWMLQPSMARLAAENRALAERRVEPVAGLPDFLRIGPGDPRAFFAGVRDRLKGRTVVFVGDSQGMVTKDQRGPTYTELVARELARRGEDVSVLCLHLGGANTFEQGTLLLGMLRAGIVPRVVFWSNSVYSLRKNDIRSDLAALYRSLPAEDTGGADAVLAPDAEGPPAQSLPPPQRVLAAAARRLDDWSAASATVAFSRRELWEKGLILARCRIVPVALRPRTAEQRDPVAANLVGSASFAGQVTGVLTRHGVRVVSFLGPIRLTGELRPFTPKAEAAAYPALERAVRAAGGEFVSWVGLLPDSCYGTYEDGSQDCFHMKEAGHVMLARRCLDVLGREPITGR